MIFRYSFTYPLCNLIPPDVGKPQAVRSGVREPLSTPLRVVEPGAISLHKKIPSGGITALTLFSHLQYTAAPPELQQFVRHQVSRLFIERQAVSDPDIQHIQRARLARCVDVSPPCRAVVVRRSASISAAVVAAKAGIEHLLRLFHPSSPSGKNVSLKHSPSANACHSSRRSPV